MKSVDLTQFPLPQTVGEIGEILAYVDKLKSGNTAAKASIDIALHDLVAKVQGIPCAKLLWCTFPENAVSSFTLGIATPEVMRRKVNNALDENYPILKVKLWSQGWIKADQLIIDTINEEVARRGKSVELYVDANEWRKEKNEALEMIHRLANNNVTLVEQPMPSVSLDSIAEIKENSPLPIFADEGVQRLADIQDIQGAYSWIVIKLMKCTWIHEALLMIQEAKKYGMKVMLGCMTETSCAISAIAHLAWYADYLDLDGNMLIANDPYKWVRLQSWLLDYSQLNSVGFGITKNKI